MTTHHTLVWELTTFQQMSVVSVGDSVVYYLSGMWPEVVPGPSAPSIRRQRQQAVCLEHSQCRSCPDIRGAPSCRQGYSMVAPSARPPG